MINVIFIFFLFLLKYKLNILFKSLLTLCKLFFKEKQNAFRI
jgi:hypothetical protein